MGFPIERRSILQAAGLLPSLVTGGTPILNTQSIQNSVNGFLARGLDTQTAEALSSLVVKLLPLSVNPDPGTRLRQELGYREVAEENVKDMFAAKQNFMLGEHGSSFEASFTFLVNGLARILKHKNILPNNLSMVKSEFWPAAFHKFHYSADRLKKHNQERQTIVREAFAMILDLQKKISESKGRLSVKKFVEILTADKDLLGLREKIDSNSDSITDQFLIKPMKERLRNLKPDAKLTELLQALWRLDAPLIKTLEDLLRQSAILSRTELLNKLEPLLEKNEITAIHATVENSMPQIIQAYHDFRILDQGGDITFKDEVPEFAAYKGRRLYPSHLSSGDRTIGKSLSQMKRINP